MGEMAGDSEKRDTVPENDQNTDVIKKSMGFGVRQTWVRPPFTTKLCDFGQHT